MFFFNLDVWKELSVHGIASPFYSLESEKHCSNHRETSLYFKKKKCVFSPSFLWHDLCDVFESGLFMKPLVPQLTEMRTDLVITPVGTLAGDLLATVIFSAISISWGDYFKRSILDQVWTVSSGWRVSPVIACLGLLQSDFLSEASDGGSIWVC